MDKNQELREKETRLWHFLKELDLEGALISKRSNFAWFTGGGDNHMFLASELGAASLLVTEEGKYLLAHTMDGDRIMTEEIPGQGVEVRAHTWFEGRQKTLEELTKGRRIGCDIPTPGLEFIDRSWREIIFPLTEPELERARGVGRLADEAMSQVCHAVRPEDTEMKVAGMLAKAYIEAGMPADVLLVGSDERLYKYRHCLPTDKPIEKLLLVHVAGQKCGLHGNVTRMVHFGSVPAQLKDRHRAVSYVHSVILANLKPGECFVDLFDKIKAAYAESGYTDEWRGHFQGDVAGYEACEPYLLVDPRAVIQVNQTYDWLPTVPGTKSEELSLLTEEGADLISLGSDWPTLSFTIGARTFKTPDILERL